MKRQFSDKNFFSLARHAKSFRNAFRGIKLLIKTQQNAWIHIGAGMIVILFGFYFSISPIEWAIIIFTIGAVLAAEAFNTALEIDMDLTSPNYNPYAKNTKDMAAGAVLITVCAAVVVGIIIFGPKITGIV